MGLSGVLSLRVLERRREIGVMRAIGASSWQVIRLFVGEGVLLGLISWMDRSTPEHPRGEAPNIIQNIILGALAAFVAYGRWRLRPLKDRNSPSAA